MLDMMKFLKDDDRIVRMVVAGVTIGSKYKIKRDMKNKKAAAKPMKIGNMNSTSSIIIFTN